MSQGSRRAGGWSAVILVVSWLLAAAPLSKVQAESGKLMIPPGIETVATLETDEGPLRAIVHRQEIYPFLTLELYDRGGEGAPASLIWSSEFSQFSEIEGFEPDGITELSWQGGVLHFTVSQYIDGSEVFRRCQLKGSLDAMPQCEN